MNSPFGTHFHNDMERTPPQTESTAERGFDSDADDSERGRSELLDDDEPGDIADEGGAHRG
jgi:hypothetical protein